LGPGSDAAAGVASWLLGWSRCWLQAGRSRRRSTC
ncbi:hypothetical protein HaLaN_32535, partial [Haematococcus lacustris]